MHCQAKECFSLFPYGICSFFKSRLGQDAHSQHETESLAACYWIGGCFLTDVSNKNRAKGIKRGQVYLCITGPLCRQSTVTHGPHIGAALGKTFPSNDVILCTAFDTLSAGWYNDTIDFCMEIKNALKSNLKKIINQFHTEKLIWIYHLEKGIILSHPQSIAAETWLPFQVCKLLYLIQISPGVRNEIQECRLQNRGHFVSATMC